MTVKDLTTLPDFGAARGLSEALWETGELRGAAVMVGAGFSKNARLANPHARQPPLWWELAQQMTSRLYPDERRIIDPLRLAEEFRAALGQSSLDALIRFLVPDHQWQPGPLHEKLVKLPWADILTTNWDTLLERASAEIPECTYEPVRTVAEIARTRSPRIVKLHGSLPSHTPFVVAEEDYRTYPVRFAPFVNLARQVLLENELCLLGFSGDDPNFLQWSGWVRDELGSSSRRIHLVGVLNLSSATRKLLEARNVAPIDLAPLVQDVNPARKHQAATELFLGYLASSRPWPRHLWPKDLEKPACSPDEAHEYAGPNTETIEALIASWQGQRERYPGWLVCPYSTRLRLRLDTEKSFEAIDKGLHETSPRTRAELLFELGWRFDVAYWPIQDHLEEQLSPIIEASNELPMPKRLYLAMLLLRKAREENSSEKFERWNQWIEQHTGHDPQQALHALYQRCLWSRDHLEFSQLEQELQHLEGEDPAWLLRRGALLSELGQVEQAETCIFRALRALRTMEISDRKSIWINSRQGWALMLARTCRFDASERAKEVADLADVLSDEDWPLKYAACRSDPWDEIHHCDYEVNRALNEKEQDAKTIEPRFDAGAYTDRSDSIRFVSSTVVSPGYQFVRMIDDVGFPPVLKYTDLADSRLARILDLLDAPHDSVILYRVLDDDVINAHFGRVSVARLPADRASKLCELLVKTIEFAAARFDKGVDEHGIVRPHMHWIDRAARYVELLSRLVVRQSPEEAHKLFAKACGYLNDERWGHWRLFEPLEHLLQRTLEAMPPDLRVQQASAVLALPLPAEKGLPGVIDRWPEVTSCLPMEKLIRPTKDKEWSYRIFQIIGFASVQAPPARRAAAVQRLCLLNDAQVLTEAEIRGFRDALWSQRDAAGLPAATQLYADVFLRLPAPDDVDIRGLLANVYHLPSAPLVAQKLTVIARAASPPEPGPQPLLPGTAMAQQMLHMIINWQPSPRTTDPFANRRERDIERTIGPALANAILPALQETDLPEGHLAELMTWIAADHCSSALQALPELCRLNASYSPDAVALLRRRLLSRDPSHVEGALQSIWKWIHRSSSYGSCPKSLSQIVVASVAARRFPKLALHIDTAHGLFEAGLIDDDEVTRLIEGLESLIEETAYQNWDTTHSETHTLSMLRKNCVSLAQALLTHGHHAPVLKAWISAAENDPTPEVRFVLL